MCKENRIYKRSRLMYIFEAALEYFISILVASSFLATLTNELQMPDSLTGILSSIISLGCLFQLISILIRPNSAKKFVIVMSIINQLLFTFLYVVPIFPVSKEFKIIIFIVLIFSAYFIYNIAHPKKINWMMSVVDDSKRGSFTANKEIISLITGMTFSLCMGSLVDSFKEKGQTHTAFILSAAVMMVLTVLHTATMIFTVERKNEIQKKQNIAETVSGIVKNKNVLKVSFVFILYYLSTYISSPFYGTYLIHELECSLKFTTVLAMVESVTRIFVSKFWGRYADKNSFASLTKVCLVFLALGYLSVIFAVPSNGKIMFALYHVFHGIAMGGISSALINLIFDYVSFDKRADSLAVCQAASGTMGFVATVCVSPVISTIQQNGNIVLGFHIYGQQLVSVLSLIITVFTVIFIEKAFKSKK